jgi:hypothetical protein
MNNNNVVAWVRNIYNKGSLILATKKNETHIERTPPSKEMEAALLETISDPLWPSFINSLVNSALC